MENLSLLEMVARAMRRRRFERTGVLNAFDADVPATAHELDDARSAIVALRSHTLVWRETGPLGGVVHEIRGAPDDIWKTLLGGVLSEEVAMK